MKYDNWTIKSFEKIKNILMQSDATINMLYLDTGLHYYVIQSIIDYMKNNGLIIEQIINNKTYYSWIGKYIGS